MHFGLYAFDLYLQIYTEAWEIALGKGEQAKDAGAFLRFSNMWVGLQTRLLLLEKSRNLSFNTISTVLTSILGLRRSPD